jgi:UDP-4-amino-4-deoxy-L-arabinose-oxoglutarate aminotransferase
MERIEWPRQKLAALYLAGLQGVTGLDLPCVPPYDHTHAWHLFIVKIRDYSRDMFMQKLADYNLGYGLHFPPAHTLSFVRKKYNSNDESLQETNRAGDKIISLPLFPDITEKDVQYVCAAIKEILKNG